MKCSGKNVPHKNQVVYLKQCLLQGSFTLFTKEGKFNSEIMIISYWVLSSESMCTWFDFICTARDIHSGSICILCSVLGVL